MQASPPNCPFIFPARLQALLCPYEKECSYPNSFSYASSF